MAKQAYNRSGGLGPMMGGPRRGGAERSRDFKGAWAKLLRYCRKYWPAMIVALV